MHLADMGLVLNRLTTTYPASSLGVLAGSSSGILCFDEMNCRNMLVRTSSKLRVAKAARNLRSLREFLVAGFLRFMKWSNIIDLSYFCCSAR